MPLNLRIVQNRNGPENDKSRKNPTRQIVRLRACGFSRGSLKYSFYEGCIAWTSCTCSETGGYPD